MRLLGRRAVLGERLLEVDAVALEDRAPRRARGRVRVLVAELRLDVAELRVGQAEAPRPHVAGRVGRLEEDAVDELQRDREVLDAVDRDLDVRVLVRRTRGRRGRSAWRRRSPRRTRACPRARARWPRGKHGEDVATLQGPSKPAYPGAARGRTPFDGRAAIPFTRGESGARRGRRAEGGQPGGQVRFRPPRTCTWMWCTVWPAASPSLMTRR